MMTTMYVFSLRKSCVLVLCSFCLAVMLIYMAYERQLVEFYAQDSALEKNSKSRSGTQKKINMFIDPKHYKSDKNRPGSIETTTSFSTSVHKSSTPASQSKMTGSLLTTTGSLSTTTETLSTTTGTLSMKTGSSSTTKSVLSSSQTASLSLPGNKKSLVTNNMSSSSSVSSSTTTISSVSIIETSMAAVSSGSFTSTEQTPESKRTHDAHKTANENSDDVMSMAKDFIPVVIDANFTLIEFKNDVKVQKHDEAGNENKTNFDSYRLVHRERIKQIKLACLDKKTSWNNTYKGQSEMIFYKSQNYNFSYCKVPKSGSTFWTKTFGVLKRGLNYGKFIFNVPRRDVHNSMLQFMTSVYDVIDENSRTILVSRDPYSRLFSAYIDKSFLLLMISLNYRIRHIPEEETHQGLTCPIDVTFQEFLDWIILQGRQGKMLNRHWSPISSLCWPCKVNSFILVKQETFANDVEFALQQVEVEKEKLDYIKLALHGHRAELSLPGIIDTLFRSASSRVSSKCLGYMKFSRRIWISLQIQGYIDYQVEFPLEKIKQTQLSNSKYFTDIVLQTLHDFPLTFIQGRQQRFRYLYQAFKTIRPETIQGIEDLYRQDFELFGYSFKPPTQNVNI